MATQKIIIVDDAPDNLRILNEILVNEGYTVGVFQEAETALKASIESPPDLFLIDILMPGTNGYDLCMKLKNNAATKDVPVIFLTAIDTLEDKLKAFSIGGVDYITKPYQSIEVLARIKNHLKIRELQEELQETNSRLEKLVELRTRKLEERNRELEEANKVKSNFIANISHELRTPIHGVSGMLDILQNMDFPDNILYFIDMAVASADNLSSIIQDILDYSDIDSGRMGVFTEQVNIPELVENVAAIFRNKNSNTEIIIKGEESSSQFHGDRIRLAQILEKLISNAVKFSDNRPVTVTYGFKGNKLVLTVSDRGIGIPPSRIGEIFSPFHQLEDPYTKKYSGTGLGLSIVKKLVDLLNGNIDVTSETGEGTTFTITIPDSSVRKEPQDTGRDISAKSVQQKENTMAEISILIAEDSAINRLWLKEILKPSGYNILEAENGKDAADTAVEKKPELIFMDMGMPVLNGIDATKRIRSNSTTAEIPIIALTAHTHKDDIRNFLQAGVNEVIPKPYRKTEIYSVLQKYIKNS